MPASWQDVLRFANGETDRSESHHYVDLPENISNATGHTLNPMHAILAKQARRWHKKTVDEWRDLDAKLETERRTILRNLLSGIVDDPIKALDRFLPVGTDFPRNIWMLPSLQRERRGATLKGHIFITEPESFDIFVSILLLDEERGFGTDLCRCTLQGCEKFFLVYKPPIGRPQSRYCTREHMLEAHARTATKRARKSREDRK
jgi:hypothetical protein